LQNEGFGPIIIAYDQEPLHHHYNKTLFDFIIRNFKDDDGHTRTIILLNTEKESKEKNKILKFFHFKDANYFFHGLAAADWYRGYYYDNRLVKVNQRTLKKKYITFNRITGNSRVYRSFLIAELAKKNLLDYGNISYSNICPIHGHYEKNLLSSIDQYNLDKNYVANTKNILDKVSNSLRIDSADIIPNGSQTLGPILALMESFLHVVTETCFWDERTHLTEKIFKPIVAKQPFVLVGCAGNLKYLKSYGFKTFDRWWDESYDEIQDPILRLQKIVEIIDEVCAMSFEELHNIMQGMKHVLDHNYELFYSKDFVDNIWKEMTSSLDSAIAQQSPQTLKEN